MTTLVWILPDGSRRSGTLDQKPFIANHYNHPGPNKVLFVPFHLLKNCAVNVSTNRVKKV